ncbi:AAA family ATPase [Microbacterium barkeri]|uniref:MinD/ParA family ATP-binding protein n=1 Tax=Microbacterium barkeri TaxID=33917 RepID=UPI0024AFB68E|nr:AAA family ATPase [Microbacterium barkeri]MDI6943566.1 AAA family ATPase [Microbacterium barkeri]
MSSDRSGRPEEEPEDHGVLEDTGIDTTAIGILGTHTAQVRVVLPQTVEDPDDDVVDDDIPGGDVRRGGIVIELPADEPDDDLEVITGELDEETVAAARESTPAETVEDDAEADGAEPDGAHADDAEAREPEADDAEALEAEVPDAHEPDAQVEELEPDDDLTAAAAEAEEAGLHAEDVEPDDQPTAADDIEPDDQPDDRADEPTEVEADTAIEADEAEADTAAASDDAQGAPDTEPRERRPVVREETLPPGYDSFLRSAAASARDQEEPAEHVGETAPDGAVADAREEDMSESTENAKPAPPITRPSFIEQAKAAPESSPAPARKPRETASRRAGEVSENAARESADVLTADRLLDTGAIHRPEPEGPWRQLVYRLSGHLINLGDSRRTRERKELSRRIAAPLSGAARFVPVLSRKGGVGKTTVTALLGMALADARDDRVIAVDANPDRGTLAERIARATGKTVRDLVRNRDAVHGYADMSSHVVRDETRLDVLASDTDPHVSEAFSDQDYRDVADVAAHYYSIVLTDTGTGIVHSVMGATLDLADQIVVVAGLSVDEARLASETLTWLESNGFADQVRSAVVVLNQSTPGAPLVRLDELDAHFRSRVRAVVRIPYDPQLATGSAIAYGELAPATRDAARELAARVVEGLRQPAQEEK